MDVTMDSSLNSFPNEHVLDNGQTVPELAPPDSPQESNSGVTITAQVMAGL